MSYNGVTGRTHEYILTGLEQIADEFEQDNDMALLSAQKKKKKKTACNILHP